MKKIFIFSLILSLIIFTSVVKNSTKNIDNQIYSIRENILFLEKRFKDTKLEFDYLSSSERLLEFQKQYFEDYLVKKTLEEFKTIKIQDDKLIIKNLTILGKKNE